MAMTKHFLAVDVDDAKVAELTADTGAAPTYAAAIDIPAIVELALTEVSKSTEFEGDASVIGGHKRTVKVNFDLRCNAVPLDVLALWSGSTLAASGVTPNQLNTLSLLSTDLAKYFKLSGRWLGVEGFDDPTGKGLQVVLYKCKMMGDIKYSLNGETASVQASGVGYRTLSNKKIRDFIGQETQGVL